MAKIVDVEVFKVQAPKTFDGSMSRWMNVEKESRPAYITCKSMPRRKGVLGNVVHQEGAVVVKDRKSVV